MLELVQKGGPIVYMILLCSVVAFAIIIERFYHLHRAKIDTGAFMATVMNTLKHNRIQDALKMCENTPGPVAHIVKSGILKRGKSKVEIREAIENACSYEIPRLEKRISVLATIAHITPLLGLLGTVTGMVKAFKVIEEKSLAMQSLNPGVLAGGIWEALITTVFGLSIAIPAFIAYNYFVNRVNYFIIDMEKSATEVVDTLVNNEWLN